MSKINKAVAVFAAVTVLSLAPAVVFAQSAQPATTPDAKAAPAAPAATTPAPASPSSSAKPRSAASMECSKEADAKGLKGKERKKFRSECKKNAMAKPG
jgi:hypothetical protein